MKESQVTKNKSVSRDRAGVASVSVQRMTDKQFSQFSQFITSELGIKLPPSKKHMLEARLQKRLRFLDLPSYGEYCDYVFSQEGMKNELPHLYNVVTTNTTHFFREPKHFDILSQRVLPSLYSRRQSGKRLEVWSAGCSTGEEPYTLAMVLAEFAARNTGFNFSIMASDISTEVLQHGARAIYTFDKIEPVPQAMKKKYLLKSKDPKKGLVRIVPELRSRINFRRLNFMREFDFRHDIDIIFCRNVVIYFDRPTQEVLFKRFCSKLVSGGFLFIGHSESITGLDLPLRQVAPTVYERE